MISEGLALLCKTADGLAHAYVRFDCHEKYVIFYKFSENNKTTFHC